MSRLSRRRFFGSLAAVTAVASSPPILTKKADAAGAPELKPRKLPFPPNDNFGSYEPTISADGNTIYFARFGNNGDTRVKGPTDIFVTHRVRQSGEWPGTAEDWSPAERLPDTVNSDSVDQEPWITPDGNTLYFMSFRKAPGVGPAGIWVSHKQADGEWGQAQPVPGGNINISEYRTHCFMPFDLPGQPSAMCFISIRPRGPGAPNTTDLYTTRQVDGVWQPAQRYADRLLELDCAQVPLQPRNAGRLHPRRRLRPRFWQVPHFAFRALRPEEQGVEGADCRGAVQRLEHRRRVPEFPGQWRKDDLVGWLRSRTGPDLRRQRTAPEDFMICSGCQQASSSRIYKARAGIG